MKAVFLDRDGTINVDTGYIDHPSKLVFVNGAVKALKILKDKGFLIFVISNQSGVGRGYFTKKDLESVNERLIVELARNGIILDGIFCCIHHPKDNCRCRKPNPYIVKKIAKKHEIDFKKSFFIGDKYSDIKTGSNVGCKTVLIKSPKNAEGKEKYFTEPDFIAKNILDAVKWVLKRIKK